MKLILTIMISGLHSMVCRSLIYLLNENEIFFGITAKLEALIPRVFDSNMFKRINMAGLNPALRKSSSASDGWICCGRDARIGANLIETLGRCWNPGGPPFRGVPLFKPFRCPSPPPPPPPLPRLLP